MKNTELTSKPSRNERTFFTLVVMAFMLVMLVISLAAYSQEAIKLPAKPHAFAKGATFTNAQGFTLPASIPDTTKVYQIGDKGAKFYFRQSKKTGTIYKVYLKKDSTKINTL